VTTEDPFKTGGGIDELEGLLNESDNSLVGQVLGNYRIRKLIAEGGMGRVFLGVRDDGQFDREVAIKLLPPGTGSEHIRRFEQERRILASLVHPNIAQLYDAGLSASSGLFLVIEYVDGMPVDDYVRERALGVRARTRLMLTLAEALAFAHARLVVHRDLKPSNVFVTGDGQLKLLDFGIAKILESAEDMTAESRPMTPRYASPEQLLNEPISVASDIYQFGLLFLSLFERRADLDDETRASATRRAVDKRSITAESQIQTKLPTELTAILNKCLRAEAEERYESANELAQDLRNYLDGYPVNARNPGAWIRGIKFLKRNWLPTSALTFAFVSLCVFLGISLRQQAVTEEARALSEETTGFLVGLFNANRPDQALGEELSARDILDQGLRQLESLDEQPKLKAKLLDTLARVYRSLGDNDKALELAFESLEIKERIYRDEPLEVASTLGLIARLQTWFGRYEQALETGQQIHRIYVAELGRDSEEALDALYVVGTAHQRLDQFDEAESALAAVLAGKRRLYGENHPDVTTAINNLAVLNGDRGNFKAAVELMEQVIRWNVVQIPPNHPWAATDWSNYGGFLSKLGRHEEAIAALKKSLAIREEVLGEEHPMTGESASSLAVAVQRAGDLDEALRLRRRALQIYEGSINGPHLLVAATLAGIGSLETLSGDYESAERHLLNAADQYRHIKGQRSYELTAMLHLARLRIFQQREVEALDILTEIEASDSSIPQLYETLPLKASALRQLGRYDEAQQTLDEAMDFLSKRVIPAHPAALEAKLQYAMLLLDQQRPGAALPVIDSTIANSEETLKEDHWRLAVARALRAEAELALSPTGSAAADLEAATQALLKTLPASHPAVLRAQRVAKS